MGRFDDAAREAADETDEVLSEKLKKLSWNNAKEWSALIPNNYDQCLVGKLIKRLKKSTATNYRVGVYKAFARKASDVAVKAVKKIIGA